MRAAVILVVLLSLACRALGSTEPFGGMCDAFVRMLRAVNRTEREDLFEQIGEIVTRYNCTQ